MGALWFLTGGARSGKSTFAVRLARDTGAPVTYLATAEPRDAEMQGRIDRHRAERPPAWTTVEEPAALAAALTAAAPGCVVVDCLTLWVSNRLLALAGAEDPAPAALAEAERNVFTEVAALLEAADRYRGTVIVVSNEVGAGVVPVPAMVRAYRDLLGTVNQRVAARAERVYLCVAGSALDLRRAGAVAIVPLPPA